MDIEVTLSDTLRSASGEIQCIAEALRPLLAKAVLLPDAAGGNYELAYLRSGGSGHVYTILHEKGKWAFCIKVLKPARLQASKEAQAKFTAEAELSRILGSVQPKLVGPAFYRVDDADIGTISFSGMTLPFFVQERGYTLARLLKSKEPPADADSWDRAFHEAFWHEKYLPGHFEMGKWLLYMLKEVDAALRSLHTCPRSVAGALDIRYHLDVKAENILVTYEVLPTSQVDRFRLMDFGSSKTANEWNCSDSIFETTHDTLPEPIKRRVDLREATSDKRVHVRTAIAKELNVQPQAIDFHQLGRVLLDILDSEQPYETTRAHVAVADRDTLVELCDSLMYSTDADDPARVDDSTTITEISDRIGFASRMLSGAFNTGYMPIPGTPLHRLDPRITHVSRERLFTRLQGIHQLGLAHLAFPGATHTRYEHSLGTFQVAYNYLSSLLSPSGSRWLAARVEKDQLTKCVLHALLHDIGHYPFAHYLEDVGLFPAHEDLMWALLTNDRSYLGLNCEGNKSNCPCKEDHEAFKCPARLVDADILESFHSALRSAFDVEPNHWIEWRRQIETSHVLPRSGKQAVYFCLSQIIDGPIDADKYDYVRRDAAHCGFQAIGGIERDLFLSSLTVCTAPSPDSVVERYVLGVRRAAHCVLEQLGLARYHLFSLVYWSPACRCYTGVLRDAVVRLFEEYAKQKDWPSCWKRIARWCRCSSDAEMLADLDNSQSDIQDEAARARFIKLVNTFRSSRLPQIIADVGVEDGPPFEAIRSKAHVLSERVAGREIQKPGWLLRKDDAPTEHMVLLGGTALVDDVSNVVATEIGASRTDVTVVVDVPMKTIGKPSEQNRCGVLLEDGRVESAGPVLDAIIPSIQRWPMRIRVAGLVPEVDLVAARRLKRALLRRYS